MNLKNLNTCIGAFAFDATGFDNINKRLIDRSPYGNHLDLKLLTAPVYATRGGFPVMDFDNTYYFEGQNLLTSGGSVVIVGVVSADAVDGTLQLITGSSRRANVGNFDGVPNEATDDATATGFIGPGNRTKFINYNGNTPRYSDNLGMTASGGLVTAGAMHLFTAACPLVPAIIMGAVNENIPATTNFAQGSFAARSGSHMRIGHLKGVGGSGGVTAGKYLSLKAAYFFTDNVFDHPDFVAARKAEIERWGI